MKTITRLLALLSIIAAFQAHADSGKVIWTNAQCGLHIVRTEGGYAFVQQLSAGQMGEGDEMEGPFEQHDRQHAIKNVTADAVIMVWIDRFSNSKKLVIERIPPRCRPKDPASVN